MMKGRKQTLFIDFSKVFDSTAHQRLLFKLSHYRLNGHIKNWMEAFLINRLQRVMLRNGVSKWNKVISGVPEGSILGQVLFVLNFVYELPSSVVSTAKLFANGTEHYGQNIISANCEMLPNDLNTLPAWSRLWFLRINALKCVVMKIREALNFIYTLNDLGVLISNDL